VKNKMADIQKDEDWMQKKWRPAMGWMYMVVCMFDMVIFPVLWSILQAFQHGQVHNQWQPLTLQGAGLFHLAMGAVLGIAAFGRTQEKVAGTAVNPVPTPVSSFVTPAPTPIPTTMGGKFAPPPASQPEL
jgi:hypothetical protein